MEKGNYIGRFINQWRQRNVAVYEHPIDASKLITVGTPFNNGPMVECVEDRADWTATLAKIADAAAHGRVYRYLLIAWFLLAGMAQAAELPYTFETLNLTVPGQTSILVPVDISDQGQILTNIMTTSPDFLSQAVASPPTKARGKRAAEWTFVSCFGVPYTDTAGIAIVDKVIIGACSEGRERGFIKPINGPLQLLDFPGSDGTRATGRSADGKLVGNFWGPLNQPRGAMAYRFHCWTLIDGVYKQIDFPAANTAVSCDSINNRGQILMWYNTVTDFNDTIEQGAVIYDNGTVTPLGLSFIHIGGPYVDFTDMNENGTVLGIKSNNDATPPRAFIWDDGQTWDVRLPDGWLLDWIGGMNNREQFVGVYRVNTGRVDFYGDPVYERHGFVATPDMKGRGKEKSK